MTATLEQIQRGATTYFESEFCQKATGVGQFAAYFALPSVSKVVGKKVEQYRDFLRADSIMDEQGNVDLDILRDRATEAMRRCGTIEVMGFRIGSSDIDRLYDCIRLA